jgi:molecular chaperone DnaK
MSGMSKVIGIDLGTSTSEVAYLKNGKPFLIPNLDGQKVTPSVVYINESGEIKVGEAACSYAVIEPENTVIEVKRLMGSQKILKPGKKSLRPHEVSAYILQYLKQSAESFLGEKVEEAVITVPAYFTNEQRVDTKKAGELAGFRVERIINEPTAAALAYGLEHMQDQKYILVYDLGGGTLDVTVLEMYEGVLDVKASCGNNCLGGKDFDEAMMDKLATEFAKQHGIKLQNDRKAMARLKEAVEKAKIELSSNDGALVDLPFMAAKEGKPLGIHRQISRNEFEKLTGEMILSTLKQVDSALADAGLKPAEIETVLLVGGSTKIPLVKRILQEKFGREPRHEVDPDEAVALGAAIQAGIKEGEFAGEDGIIITDVCPYTMGIECAMEMVGIKLPGLFDILIERNTTIPVSVRRRYQTFQDNQEEALINVYQGERMIATENNLIGSFVIGGITKAAAGDEKLDVEFSYDINGILDVKAVVVNTGKDASIRIDTRETCMKEEVDVEQGWKSSKSAKKVKSLIKKAEKMMADPAVDSNLKEEIGNVLYELKYALTKNDELFIERFDAELTELLYGAEK